MIRNSNIAGMSAALSQMRSQDNLDFDTDASAGAQTDAFLGKDAVHTHSSLRRDTSGGSKRSGSSHGSKNSRGSHRRSDLDVLAHIGHPAFSRQGSEEFGRNMGSMPEETDVVKGLERAVGTRGVDEDEMQRCSSGSSALDEYLNNRMPSFGEAVVVGR